MLEKKIYKIAFYSLLAISLLPLFFVDGFYFPFILNKVLFFRLAVEVALVCYIFLLILNYQEFKPKVNYAFWLSFLLLIVASIAAFFGLDFYRSFFSDFQRMEGVISLIYLNLYLFLLLQIVRSRKDWVNYIRAIVVVSFFVSVYGIVQKFELLPVFEAGINRISSTVGNAAFLAGYLLLSSGLSFYWALIEKNKRIKALPWIIIVVNIWALFLTGTRGAILGIMAGMAWYLLIFIMRQKGKIKAYAFVFLFLFFLFLTSFFIFRDYFQKSSIESVRRMASISFEDNTIKNRLLVWKWGINEAKENIFLGVGMENFNYVYNKYYNPEINEEWFDRTHNIYLDQLVNNGIFGLLIYLSLFGYLFYIYFKRIKEDWIIFSVMSTLLIAYSIHNFFVFDTISTSFIFYFIIGFSAFINSKNLDENERIHFLGNKLSINKKIVIFLIGVLSFLPIYYFIINPFIANRNIYIGYKYILADSHLSAENFKKALNYKMGSVETLSQMYLTYSDVKSKGLKIKTDQEENFKKIIKNNFPKVIDNFPLDVRSRIYYTQFLEKNYENNRDLEVAKNIIERAVELSPMRPNVYYLLFNIYLEKGEQEKGMEVLEKLTKVLPQFGEIKIILANSLKKIDSEKADEFFKQGIKQEYVSSIENNLRIIEYLLYFERYEEAIPYYEEMLGATPPPIIYRLDLAKLYFLTGDIDSSIEQVNLLQKEDPQKLEGAEDFLHTLLQAYAQN